MAVPSFSSSFTYDVFLSFRGEDTRYGFTGNLYTALLDSGIYTFIDDEELPKGDEITTSLQKAIEASRIFIIVFSHNYASSSFCLNELAYILPYAKRNGLLVLPLFYDVVPSHVRHHTGTFGEALDTHENKFKGTSEGFELNMEKLNRWKMALRGAANLSGYHFKHGEEYEYQFIKRIVKLVSNKINRAPLHVADYPVGLETRMLEVKLLLDVGSDDGVHMVGIHGFGGVGKTTLALAVYNSIADNFEGLCFLENVRENSNKHGLQHLQSLLLSQMVGENNINITSVKQGISMMQHRLRQKKILLILDDVDKHEQLQAIVGRADWFGPGSRVIITTRDKHLLSCQLVEKIYEVKKLKKKDALRLLSWKGFKTEEVHPSYVNVMGRVLAYASGHPLALEVIGSKLFRKSVKEWESAIQQYEKIPNNQILEILKISFDSLEEVEKSVFLDIACCFKGYELSEVENILRAHYGDCLKYHIGVLVEKSLIKYRWNSVVTLHDLIEDMGKEIVRQKSPNKPGKRSRLWSPEDIIQVLEDSRMGSGEIEIICLNYSLPDKEEIVEWNRKAFKKMKNLKTLIIKSGNFSEGPKYLPNSLRVMEWLKYPSQGLPPDFRSKELTVCKLPASCFGSLELAELSKKFMNMTLLNFDECEGLTQIPDVSGLPNLVEISFKNCKSLITIHDSIGFLGKLNSLNAVGCSKLRSFPPLKLTSLENLELSYCYSLESFPEILGKMGKITELFLECCDIKELPFSFQNLTELQTLQLRYCPMLRLPSSIVMMPKLTEIIAWESEGWLFPKQVEGEEKVCSMVCSNVDCLLLPGCKLSDDFFPITWFANVKELDLSRNTFTVLPECISNYYLLCKLIVDNCDSLREIRGIPPNIRHLSARDCKSFTSSGKSTLLNQKLHETGNTMFWFSGASFPEWFEHRSQGPSCSFWVGNKFPAIALCIVIGPTHLDHIEIVGPIMIINGIDCSLVDGLVNPYLWIPPHHTYLFDLQHIVSSDYLDRFVSEKEWNHVEIRYSVKQRFSEKDKHVVIPVSIENGIYVFKQRSSMEDIQFTDPHKKRRLDVDPE